MISVFKIALIALIGTCSFSLHAQIVRDDALKASYLVNFLEFVTWDQLPNKGHTIGVLNSEGVASRIKAISLGRIGDLKNRQIRVEHFSQAKEISKVSLLFIARGNQMQWAELVELSEKQNFILIGEEDGFLEAGGVIQFVTVNNRIRFKINSKQAKKIGVSMSSKLLSLAKEVKR